MNENQQSGMSEGDKTRIRLEEIYRDEVRQELARGSKSGSKGFFAFFNQPFAMWFMSSVVLASLSWQYRLWRERQDVAIASALKAAQVQVEMDYRIRQVDWVLANAIRNGEACLSDVRKSGEKIKGERIRDYFENARQVHVVARLGGIIQFPPPDLSGRATVWIGSSGCDCSHVPFKRGFRSEQFANDRRMDLLVQWNLAKRGVTLSSIDRRVIEEAVERFDAATTFGRIDILDDWLAREQLPAGTLICTGAPTGSKTPMLLITRMRWGLSMNGSKPPRQHV